ncbi:discoidin domain-containing protein [Paenibacillus sp. Soil787]|uniref:galactose-binding domain-containing protein n=1 Tax=Paenibacillus sp. Soil787 TaxID=1736411 RepID=UPI0006FA3832|nr:discoidin domain-containing protein [Paenibacillus sp. Soil787]KRF43829.1 hypothetical protein ASG93_02620 [Paenibacillus sp. Soil787]
MRKNKIFSFLMALILVSSSFIAYSGEVHAAVQSTLYVSPAGSGTDCTLVSPCTLQTVQSQVRLINQNMTGDIVVNLLDGTYALSSTFQLQENATVHDSGTNGYNVIYQANPGAHPVISGGTSLTNWTQHDAGKNIWRSYVGQSTGILQMYVNGVRANVARGEYNPNGISINASSSKYMLLDAFKVYDGASTSIVPDNDTNIVYTGSWAYSTSRGLNDLNNDVHYTTTSGDSAQYTFTGTGIDIIAEKHPDYIDNVNVFIDGTFVQKVSEYTSGARQVQQPIFSITGLSAGTHDIRMVNGPSPDLSIVNPTNPIYSNMSAWGNPDQIRIALMVSAQFKSCPVSSITGNSIVMQQPCWQNFTNPHSGVRSGGISWIENAYELLNAQGYFYYNVTDGYMYYIPRSFEDLSTATVMIPQVEQIVSGTGASGTPLHHIKLIGLTFEYGTWLGPLSSNGIGGGQANAIWNENARTLTNGSYNNYWQTMKNIDGNVEFNNASNIAIEGNTFRHLGGTGLLFENASQNNTVVGNSFYDISAGGIHIGDVNDYANTNASQQTLNNTVANNYITTTGVQYLQTTGIFSGYTKNLQLLHNEVDNMPYSGISAGWGWGLEPSTPYSSDNAINYNKVSNVMMYLHDGGSIYTLSRQPNSSIAYNYITGDYAPYGAIYLDNGTNNFSVNNNVVKNYVPYWYFAQNGGPVASNNVANNNFTENGATWGSPNSNGNSLTNTTVVTNGNWPTAAVDIMNNAGLESQYDYLKNNAGVIFDDSLSGILYSGTWSNDVNRKSSGSYYDFQNTGHLTSTSGSYLEYEFYGSGIDVISDIGPSNTNNASVYIDGNLDKTISENTTNRFVQQTVYRKTGLAPGVHKIKIVNNTTQSLMVDAFKVYDYSEYSSNLALNKSVAVSDIYQNDATYSGAKAVDGSDTTRWATNTGTTAATMEVDFGVSTAFNQVIIKEYKAYGNRVAGYKIQYWNGSGWVDAYTGTTLAPVETITFPTVNATKMRLNITSATAAPSIWELEVYQVPLPPVNLALNKSVTVSNFYQNNATYNGGKAVDGLGTTRWATDTGTTSATMEVDFGVDTTFNQIVMKEYKDYGNRITGYKIQYWNGSSWIDAYTGTIPAATETNTFTTVTASKVRLNITSATAAPSIWEFEVYNH